MSRRSQRITRASMLVMLFAVAWPCALMPAWPAEKYSEAAVKAAFIHRFAGYVEWPPGVATAPRLYIAVMGDAEVARQISALVARQSSAARPIEVITATRDSQLRAAHIAFIGARTSRDLGFIIPSLSKSPVLVVTDDAHGLDSGATVNFLVVDQRVRFEVSLAAAQQAGLRISSDMLSVAVRVTGASRAGAQVSNAGQ